MTKAVASVKSVSLEAKVIRADGSVKDLGRIAYFHSNPLRRLGARVRGQGRAHINRQGKS